MKKNYYILSLALATGLLASCSNDINGTGDIIPNEPTEQPAANLTRAFPEDDGAKSLPGMPAEKLLHILQGADSAFSIRMGNFKVPTDEQYQEIKAFTDELVVGRTNDAQKYVKIFDYVYKNVKYADGYVSNEPYDVFLNKKAVCQGYANLLNVMLHTQGIPVINANGWLNSGAFMGHAWNYAYYSGAWRLSDPTNSLEYKAEELDKYFERVGVRCRYIHSDVDTLERVQIIEDFKNGLFDVLIGVNLLREGLDIPEVSLICIMDADKQGFLRSSRSLFIKAETSSSVAKTAYPLTALNFISR